MSREIRLEQRRGNNDIAGAVDEIRAVVRVDGIRAAAEEHVLREVVVRAVDRAAPVLHRRQKRQA